VFCSSFVASIVDEKMSSNRKDYERFETAIECELELVLEDFLLPSETVRYESPSKIRYLGDKFYFYITNKRILASKRMFFEGKIPDMKGIWQELQKYIKKET